MTKPASASLKKTVKPKTVFLDLADSASVSRIEGLTMPRDMQRLFRNFELSGLSHEERRVALLSKYGKFSG